MLCKVLRWVLHVQAAAESAVAKSGKGAVKGGCCPECSGDVSQRCCARCCAVARCGKGAALGAEQGAAQAAAESAVAKSGKGAVRWRSLAKVLCKVLRSGEVWQRCCAGC